MRRFFVKNLLFVVIINLLVKPVWIFMIDRNVQNRVGHEAFGLYQALFNLGVIFNIVLDFGLTYYNTRIISGDPSKLKTLFPAMLSARLVLIFVYALLVTSAGILLGYSVSELLLLAGVLLIHSFSSLIQSLRSNVSALHMFKVDALLSVSDRLLMIVICGFLLFYPPLADSFKIEWFIGTQIFCYAIAVMIGFLVLRKMARTSLKFSFNYREVVDIIKQSIPYATLVFLMAVHMRVDTILVERLSGANGKEYAGIYSAAYRLLDIGNMFGILLSGMLLPMFGRMLSNKNDVQPIIKLSVNLLLPGAFIVTCATIFFGTDIMQLLYKDMDTYGGNVLAWLMGCFPAYCIMYVYSTLLTANGALKLLNRIALAGVIINLSINFYLIPTHHALGAAITACITQSVLAICYILFSGKKLSLPRNSKWVSAHIGFVLLLVLVAYGSTMLNIMWLYQLAIYTIVAVALIFAFRFVSFRSIGQLMEKS
jgi:O-antigen/teichoic acid export membrane protein